MEEDNTLKNSIVEISTHGNRYNVIRFLQAFAQCNKITYTDDIKELDVKMNLILNYKDRFDSKLKFNLILLNAEKRKLKKLNNMLNWLDSKKPSKKRIIKLTKQQKENIMQEIEINNQKSSLLLEEINNIKKMNELLDDMNFDNKEKLSNIKREMERSQIEIKQYK